MKIMLNISLLFLFCSQFAYAQLTSATKIYNSSWSNVCTCPSGKTLIGSQCFDYKPTVSLSAQSFMEGSINSLNLLTLSIESKRGVKEISANFKDFFSFTQIRIFELDENLNTLSAETLDPLSLNNDGFILNKISNNVKIIFTGATKFSINKPLDIIVKDFDDVRYMHDFAVVVQKDMTIPDSPNRYLKYNVVAVKGPTASGHAPQEILEHAQETKRIMQGWRVPILVSYSVKEVSCNGSNMNFFASKINNSESNHISCLQFAKEQEGETVFSFSNTYSSYNANNPASSSAIGGQAFGLKRGVVIDYHNVRDTLAHELGHNLGLFHTFETVTNPVRMKSFSEFHQIYKTVNMADNLPYYGDWFPGRLSSSGILNESILSSIGDDTITDLFNAKIENSISNISLAPASKVIDFSNYSIMLSGIMEFKNYGAASDVIYTDFITQNPTSQSGGFICQSDRNASYTGYISQCLPGFSLPSNVIENTMGYWRKLPSTSFLTNGQKLRMDFLINSSIDGQNIGEK